MCKDNSNLSIDIEKIKEIFQDCLDKTGYVYDITVENFGMCIKVSNEDIIFDMDDLMFVWVRTMPVKKKYIVEIATIQLPEQVRRRGTLTEIFNKLKKLSIISEIRITGVSTEPMRRFCKKHDMKTINMYDYYLEKL